MSGFEVKETEEKITTEEFARQLYERNISIVAAAYLTKDEIVKILEKSEKDKK